MLLAGRWLLPARTGAADGADRFRLDDYFTELTILEDSPEGGETEPADDRELVDRLVQVVVAPTSDLIGRSIAERRGEEPPQGAARRAHHAGDRGRRVAQLSAPSRHARGRRRHGPDGCIRPSRAYRTIDARIYVFIAGAIPLGIAMTKCGAADLLARGLHGALADWSPTVVLLVVFTVVAVLTQFMSDAATTAVFGPVAVALAQGLGQSNLLTS